MPTFSSFNAYGSESLEIGQSHVPVWLGNVSPVPVGGNLASDFLKKGILIGAGSPIKYANKVITPFVGWEVVSFTGASGSETVDTIVIKPAVLGNVTMLPAVDDKIMRVGSTFAATGKAAAVASIALIEEGQNAGNYAVTVLHSATIDSVSAGDVLALSSAESAGSSKSLKVQPNAYLYNDIYLGNLDDSAAAKSAKTIAATGAVVQFHKYGLLVDMTSSAAVKAQMQKAVPGVLQVEV